MSGPLRLVDLEPEFIRHEEREGRIYSVPVATLAEAQSIQFLCPGCFVKNRGPVGTHMVWVTFAGRNVPNQLGSQSRNGGPSRWAVAGEQFENLTLQPSVDCGCWHGFIIDGLVR